MPNNGITDCVKNALREKGCVTASEIEAMGSTRPVQAIYQLRKKGMEIRTVKTPTDVEYHLEEGGVTPEPELKEPPKKDKCWDKLKELIDIQVDFMERVGNKESTGVKTLIWIRDLMKSIEKEGEE